MLGGVVLLGAGLLAQSTSAPRAAQPVPDLVGPANTPHVLTDINPSGSSDPAGFVRVAGTIYFRANDGTHGAELWRTDGTVEGTALVADINVGDGSSAPEGMKTVDGRLFFTASTADTGREVWVSDGTADGTSLLRDINPATAEAFPTAFVRFRDALYFRAQDGTTGLELQTVHNVEHDRVVVDAGATWSQVLAATLPHGLAPPVHTDYLELSVGGALIVGGVGGTTARFGVQADNVLEMDVITGTGENVTCSPSRHRDLFDAVRAGLGQVGVITRATLALIPAPPSVRRYLLFYADLRALLNDERLLARDDRFDAVQGAVVSTPAGWMFRLDAMKAFSADPPDDEVLLAALSDDRARAQPSTLSHAAYLNRLAALEQALRANGQWFFPHPWLTTFVGDAAVDAVVTRELEQVTPADLGPLGQVVLSAFPRRAVTTPLLRLPAEDLVYAFNFVRLPATPDPAEIQRLVEANRAIYERVRAEGGALYPVSAFPMSRRDWRQHFGPIFHDLHDAKRRYDPRHVLTPGYEVF